MKIKLSSDINRFLKINKQNFNIFEHSYIKNQFENMITAFVK